MVCLSEKITKMACVVALLMLFMACNATKKTERGTATGPEIKMECPKAGTCTFSVMENKALHLREDTTGMRYPELVDNSTTSVIQFKYHHQAPEGMADGNYTELLYFEVKNNVNTLHLKDEALQQVKLLYGRLCFCPTGTGYFKVTRGLLEYDRDKNGSAVISLVFDNLQAPQIIKKIEGQVTFK